MPSPLLPGAPPPALSPHPGVTRLQIRFSWLYLLSSFYLPSRYDQFVSRSISYYEPAAFERRQRRARARGGRSISCDRRLDSVFNRDRLKAADSQERINASIERDGILPVVHGHAEWSGPPVRAGTCLCVPSAPRTQPPHLSPPEISARSAHPPADAFQLVIADPEERGGLLAGVLEVLRGIPGGGGGGGGGLVIVDSEVRGASLLRYFGPEEMRGGAAARPGASQVGREVGSPAGGAHGGSSRWADPSRAAGCGAMLGAAGPSPAAAGPA
jgi:hypothetical protein